MKNILFFKPESTVTGKLMFGLSCLLLCYQPAMSQDIVRISSDLRDRMNLKTEVVAPAVISKTLSLVGRIEPDPEKHFVITSRVPGRVTALAVVEGQSVAQNETLVEIETRQPGNPPPKLSLQAPIAGIVTKVVAKIGQGVEAGQTLVEVTNLESILAKARVFEKFISRLKVGAIAKIRAKAYPEEPFVGTLERFGGQVDQANGFIPAWFRIDNSEEVLKPGMLVNFQAVTAETNATLTIPMGAVLGNTVSPFVYVRRDKKGLTYRRAALQLGERGIDRVEVLDGLAAGNQVVSGNAHLLGLSPSGGTPSHPHGHDHGGHGHHHGSHAPAKKSSSVSVYILSWLSGGLCLSLLFNLFLLWRLRRRAKKTRGA